ncbi:MAG: CRISPR-associated endonuclease Cas1 [Verrucomicrobia bacterium]|nr:CRISPR-associated endonuclease Cas1 [Verrucomicrobiota bacterium]MCG2679251.1 CRISPR-associated endonuclease Cas1 [Kiritimatiellia bacterium]MBU4248645.1 CRISPR-associated endonuclease Cas1 [Verrucomicrobiota bacterium]MBU4290106.1 CRISPR-associated endonuclease Cas1 [Verrucomicrobiota bacterium]MBU4430468.1 CRISPR-associated endonuclease Cas1 [Verrucomicrobiota bacterium]
MQNETDQLLTIDHLHQYAYCPRRMHLMYVDGRWDNNAYTEEGRVVHTRTDAKDHVLPKPAEESAKGQDDGDPTPVIVRSVMLSSEALGLIGKPDLVEAGGGEAIPVDTKRGKPPDNPLQSYEPERVQLMAQGLLLREHGFVCQRGFLYFAAARLRVEIAFTAELEEHTRFLLGEARAHLQNPSLPDPLDDSPKCNGCSLSAICLPDETNLLNARGNLEIADVRRLYPARDDALPLYVQDQGSRVGKSGQSLVVSRGDDESDRFLLKDVSQLVLCGNIAVTPQSLHLLCESGIAIAHLSTGGWFYGITHGHGLRNAYDRAAQFAAAGNDGRRLTFARAVVEAKARNQRTLLRRNAAGEGADSAVQEMARLLDLIPRMESCESLLGIEGALASRYFANWATMVKERAFAEAFDVRNRNRRPPRDPVNSMLSYGYALLVKECTVALMGEGLDPWWGLYHRPRHGRPALALDLMEEFRPLVVDSAVLTALNTGMVGAGDFETGASGCLMKPAGRKALIHAFEQRLDQLITHPMFDYRCSWRAVVRLQARLLARWLRGDIPRYEGITTR